MKRELRTTIQTSKCGRFCLQRCRHFRELDAFCGYTAQFLDVHTVEGRVLRHAKCIRDEVVAIAEKDADILKAVRESGTRVREYLLRRTKPTTTTSYR